MAGLGFGADVHVPGFRAIPGVEVVALSGRDTARTRAMADHLGIPHAYTPATGLFDCKLDAVSLALPPDQAEEVAVEALSRGLGVLCEKPIAHTLDAAERMGLAARGRVTAVDFQFAELAVFHELRDLIADERLGRVRHVNVVWLTESWAQRQRSWSWKTNADLAGGVLTLFGSHLLHLAEWLLGPAHRLSARCDQRTTSGFAPSSTHPAEDLVHLLMEHDRGVVFAATFGNANPGLSVHRWFVVFERGSACIENPGRDYMAGFNLTVTGADGAIMTCVTEPQEGGDGRVPPFRRLASRFVEALRKGGRCEPDLAVGVRVQRLMSIVLRAAHTSDGWVAVN